MLKLLLLIASNFKVLFISVCMRLSADFVLINTPLRESDLKQPCYETVAYLRFIYFKKTEAEMFNKGTH